MSERYVNLSESTAAISGTQSYRLRVNYPATGGVQFVDATGAVINPASAIPAASLIPATDATYDLGAVGTRWRIGYFSGSVMTPVLAARTGGVSEPVASLASVASAVNLIELASAATGGAPAIYPNGTDANVSLRLYGRGTGGIQIRNSGNTATIFGVQSVASGNYAPTLWASNDSGTPGNAVINRPSGQVAVAIGAAAVTVTNDLVTATSVVICTLQFIDATFTQILSVVPGPGSFVITGNATATAATKIGFIVINPST